MNFLETAKNLETTNGHGLITYLDYNLDPITSDKDYPHLKLMTNNHIDRRLDVNQRDANLNQGIPTLWT